MILNEIKFCKDTESRGKCGEMRKLISNTYCSRNVSAKNARKLMRTTPLIYTLFLFSIAAFTLLMFSKVKPYFSVEPEIGFLTTKTNAVLRKKSFTTAFYVHILSSAWATPTGIFQFIPLSLKKYPNWHRLLGKIHVFSMSVFAALADLVYRILDQWRASCKK